MEKYLIITSLLFLFAKANAQSTEDSIAITQTTLGYIEAHQKVNPSQLEQATHPRMVKRTFWKDPVLDKEYLREIFQDAMLLLV